MKALLTEMGRRVKVREKRRKLMRIGRGIKLMISKKKDHKL